MPNWKGKDRVQDHQSSSKSSSDTPKSDFQKINQVNLSRCFYNLLNHFQLLSVDSFHQLQQQANSFNQHPYLGSHPCKSKSQPPTTSWCFIAFQRWIDGGVLVLAELLTLTEVSERLKLSRTTIWRLRSEGYLKTISLKGIIRVRLEDLDQFVAEESLKGRDR